MANSEDLRRFSSTIVLMCFFAVFLSSFYPGGVYASVLLMLFAVGAILSYAPKPYRTRYLSICALASAWVLIVLYVTLTA